MENKLNHLPDKSRQAVTKFAKMLIEAFGNKLHSLLLFGSAAQSAGSDIDGFKEGASDINTVIILENVTTNDLNMIGNIGRKFKKSGLAIPLVFKRGHIPSSLDTFPLEFSDMKQNHILLHGADPLAEAQIETGNLRHQCETQFKSQLVQLRRGYLAAAENHEAITALITSSVTSIMAACRGMAFLAGKTPPDNKSDLLKMIQDDYDIDIAAIDEAWRLKRGEVHESTATLEILFDKYLIAIEKLTDVVDRM
jgi:hypothetical protein